MKRALVLLLLVAACGGSSGGDKGTSAKATYLKQAEAICDKANADLATAKKSQPTGLAGISPYVHRLADIARTNLLALSALTPPPADAADVKAKVLDPLRAQERDAQVFTKAVDVAVGAKDQTRLFALVTNPPTKTRADIAWMKSYGFSSCAKAADTGSAGK